jgi:putative redox protein
MVEMTAVYKGQKHCEMTHGPSKAIIETDAPKDNHGRGEAFSPTDLMAASLGVCMLTVMGIQADQKGWNMEGSKVHLIKEMVTNPRRIGKLTAHLEMPAHLNEEARNHLEKTASSCPVKQSLHPDIILDIKFTYI